MDFLMPREAQLAHTVKELEACNQVTEGYGLALTGEQMKRLAQRRMEALEYTDRVEFGGGVLKKLIFAFRDSPYLVQREYEETIGALQDLFYQLKSETRDRLSDDELIELMKDTFDGRAEGSLERLADLWEAEDPSENTSDLWGEEDEE